MRLIPDSWSDILGKVGFEAVNLNFDPENGLVIGTKILIGKYVE